jgi:hypothetical protein
MYAMKMVGFDTASKQILYSTIQQIPLKEESEL